MTPTTAQIETEAAVRSAQQDLEDISTLKRTDAFERYWLRRLRSKQAALEERFRNDPPEKCSKDQREEIRLQIVLIDELMAMMKRDEASAKAMVQRHAQMGRIT